LKSFDRDRYTFLENAIDRLQQLLPELKDFILPGGHMSSAWAHIARAVCRRVERRVVRLLEKEGVRSESFANALIYLNRLSDYFFVLGRWCNFQHSMTDTIWGK
jgi:cob(I)alamin adenosyltransferase